MTQGESDGIAVELTPSEAKLIIAALRRFQPYWPSDMDEMSRTELLAEIRQGVEHVLEVLKVDATPS
jgi:hypothetical protein